MSKRVVSLLLSIVLVLSSMSFMVAAEEPDMSGQVHIIHNVTVSVQSIGAGSGTIGVKAADSTDAFASSIVVPIGTKVTVSASPDPNSTFHSWKKEDGVWVSSQPVDDSYAVDLNPDGFVVFTVKFCLKPVQDLSVAFNEGLSTPHGQYHWTITNPNDFNVNYTYEIGGPSSSPMATGSGLALPGDNDLQKMYQNDSMPRIDKISIWWGVPPAYPEDSSRFLCPAPSPSATAFSKEFVVLYAETLPMAPPIWGDVQIPLGTSIIGNTFYWINTTIQPSAEAEPYADFDEWSSDLSGSDNPATLLMSNDKKITAIFTPHDYLLTLDKKGNGTGEVIGEGTYPAMSTPSISASPDMGSYFEGWYHGEMRVTSSPCYTLPALNAPTTYTANFLKYSIDFEKIVRLPASMETEVPEDGQFEFRLESYVRPDVEIPMVSNAIRKQTPHYDATVTNDENGMVHFSSYPSSSPEPMYLIPGMYVLTETDDPEDDYMPCTIPEGGLLIRLCDNGRFRVIGPAIPPVPAVEAVLATADGPEYSREQRTFKVFNCTVPNPAITIDKKANGSDGPITIYTDADPVSYTIYVKNTGNVKLTNVVVEDGMAPNVQYVLPDLEPNDDYSIPAYTKSYPSVGSYTNTASVIADAFATPEPNDTLPPLDSSISLCCMEECVCEMPEPTAVGNEDMVTVHVTNRPSRIPTPGPRQDVNLTIEVIGPGSVLPLSGPFGINTIVLLSPTPNPGAQFDGWSGTNGDDVSDDRITMNTDKTLIATFSEIVVPQLPVPEALPVIVPSPAPETAPEVEPIVEEIPQATPVLPKTSGLPIELLGYLGAGLVGMGTLLRKIRK